MGIRKIDKSLTRPSAPSLDDRITTVWFRLIVFGVFLSSIFIFLKFRKIYAAEEVVRPETLSFPAMSEIVQNLGLAFQGYTGGYLRSLFGVLFFLLMASFFVSAGKFALTGISSWKGGGSRMTDQMNLPERIAVYYILGSLVASLLWLGLGLAGILNFYVSLTLGLAGLLALLVQLFRSRLVPWMQSNTVKPRITEWWNQLTLTEKLLFLVITMILLLFCTYAVNVPQQNDTLYAHAALPNYYINEGKVVFNPHHFYSYMTQNTEMLVMWALLLKSEFSANLVSIGFIFPFVLLIWGFVKRHSNNLVAFTTIFVFLSAPAVFFSTTYIKNDLTLSIFMFAHYYAMIEAFNRRTHPVEDSKRWMLLAGILCGGAIGHKLLALPFAFFSSVTVLGYDFYLRKKKGSPDFLIPTLLVGILIAGGPWFLRSLLENGNPVYPFLSMSAKDPILVSWYIDVHQGLGHTLANIWVAVKSFYQEMLFGIGMPNTPKWGPAILFGFLTLLFVRKRSCPVGFRLCFLAALLSFALLLFRTNDVRYHMSLLIFLVCVPFALIWNAVLKTETTRVFKFISIGTIVYCLFQVYSSVNVWILVQRSLSKLISGNTMGNYRALESYVDDLYWMNHIINTRTDREDTVLYAGVRYCYGLNRKIIWNSPYSMLDREVLADIAERSANSMELRENLRNMSVDHVLAGEGLGKALRNPVNPEFRLSDENLAKITDFFEKHMVLRYSTPDKTFSWYSFRDAGQYQPIVFDARDAQEFPVKFLHETNSQYRNGYINAAHRMIKIAVDVPMEYGNKLMFYNSTGVKYSNENNHEKATQFYKRAIALDQDDPLAYYNMGNLYFSRKEYDKSMRYYIEVVEKDPKYADAYNNLGAIYFAQKDYQKAIEHFETAVSLRPKEGRFRKNLELLQKLIVADES